MDSNTTAVKSPERMCVVCRQKGEKSEYFRVVKNKSGGVEVDLSGKLPGRGAYVHKSEGCLKSAVKRRSLDKALKCRVPDEVYAALEEEFV
ncbi:MAG: YlxR family protein [Oscillospiraceae bacterium]|nr:YlxR family protein [Oscillospiraceae bacterium]